MFAALAATKERTLLAQRRRSVAIVGSYVPRRCGIATFSNDLYQALVNQIDAPRVSVVALNDRPGGYEYPREVEIEINQDRRADYVAAAESLNRQGVDSVFIQHEFGIFGGDHGDYITHFMAALRMPVVTTLHTVLHNPTDRQRQVTKQVVSFSDRVVVMSETGRRFLVELYGVPAFKVEVIPHGTPDLPFADTAAAKSLVGLAGRTTILTFGLLSGNKGIETMIRAMPAIRAAHPDSIYVVLGAAHPNAKDEFGGPYTDRLHRLVEELGLGSHVVFEDRYVDLDELGRYLSAADVYVTPYLNIDQIASGTLSYALACGIATVSTPYWYAQEMLAGGRGLLVPVGDEQALAAQVGALLSDPLQRETMRRRAYEFSRSRIWSEVGRSYLRTFIEPAPGPVGRPAVRRSASEALAVA